MKPFRPGRFLPGRGILFTKCIPAKLLHTRLTQFIPLVSLFTPQKHQKHCDVFRGHRKNIRNNAMFSGDIEKNIRNNAMFSGNIEKSQRHEIG